MIETTTSIQRVAALRPTIDQLRVLSAGWADLLYALEKYAAAYDFLLAHYAKFHTDDRVRLRRTPRIDAMRAPGWLGSKHFLVAGALGTVRDVDFRQGTFYYQIVFDAESWLDQQKVEHAIEPAKRASYCFQEDELAKQGEIV
jgi:hypothetical protein